MDHTSRQGDWGSNVQQTDGQADGLIERADEGEKTGHISALGYPMTLYTNYGIWTKPQEKNENKSL